MLLFTHPGIILLAMFFGTPICLTVFFILALIKFLRFRSRNRKAPGSVPDHAIKRQRNAMFLWGGLALAVIAIEVRLLMLLSTAVMYM